MVLKIYVIPNEFGFDQIPHQKIRRVSRSLTISTMFIEQMTTKSEAQSLLFCAIKSMGLPHVRLHGLL